MKFSVFSLVAILSYAAPIAAQKDKFMEAFEVLRATVNINDSIDSLKGGFSNVQPSCHDPTDNCE